jgi:hypothetical protein
MIPYEYEDGMDYVTQANGAYWERNMLALFLANQSNKLCEEMGLKHDSGYFIHGEWEGWDRVISIQNGQYTFHVPNDFDLGNLKEIQPNWDGHTTQQKWLKMMEKCGIEFE